MLRKVTAGFAAVVMVASLAACSSPASGSAEKDDTIVVGLAVANLQADYFNQVRKAVQAEAKGKHVKVIVADAKGDSDSQVSQIQDFITQEVDAIIYIPAGAAAASVPVRNAQAAGIPVVTVDRNPDKAPGDTFIATDSVAAAKELGDYVTEVTGGTGKLAVIQGQTGTTPELARDKGFKAAMKDAPGIKEVTRQASKAWAQDEGFSIAQDMLQSHPDITIFFGRADGLALGAAQAVRAAGREKEVTIVGFDGDVAGLEAVRDGVLAATITQPSQGEGRLALESALKLIKGEKVDKEQLQPGVLTTKENVDEFIAEHP